jgi:hypothetical protein
MKLSTILISLFLLLGMAGCLDRTFIADPLDPRMPAYTEKGANTAGALIDNRIWIASSLEGPGSNEIFGDEKMFFFFSGASDSLFVAFQSGKLRMNNSTISVGFYIPGPVIRDTEDLYDLEGRTISLDGQTHYGQLFYGGYRTINGPVGDHRGTGALHFRNIAQSEDSARVNVSGTFGFDIMIDSVLHTVHSGRFDYAVGNAEIREIRP